jgi:hypothetical protein
MVAPKGLDSERIDVDGGTDGETGIAKTEGQTAGAGKDVHS